MNPHTTIRIAAIWLGVGFSGFFIREQAIVALIALFAMFATGIVGREDRG